MPVALPEGFGGLRFESELVSSRVTVNEQGFTYHEPILPGTPQELIFTFTLPYTRSLEFIQPIDYPVDAVVLLAEEGAPELTGSGLIDGGTRQLGELALRTYTIDALEPGSTLALQFRGRHPAGSSGISTTNLLIGAGVLVLTVALVLFVWQTWTARSDMEPVGAVNVARQTRTSLLQAIAGLDDAYEGGEIEESIYEEQRAGLKRQLIELIAQEDD